MKKIPFKVLSEIKNSSSVKIGGLVLDESNNITTCYTVSGGYKTSAINETKIPSMELIKKIQFPDTVFLTDLTLLNDKLYVLTMNEEKCYVYSKDLKSSNTISFSGKGWGLTNNGEHLIMGDLRNNIVFRCPQSFEIIKTLSITTNNKPLVLGSLTFGKGLIWANPLGTPSKIICIDPDRGDITQELNVSSLVDKERIPNDSSIFYSSLAIFYDQIKEQIAVTSNQWEHIYMLSSQ